MDAKKKDEDKARGGRKDSQQYKYDVVGDESKPAKKEFFLVAMLKAIWNFKAGLFMMATGICWYSVML